MFTALVQGKNERKTRNMLGDSAFIPDVNDQSLRAHNGGQRLKSLETKLLLREQVRRDDDLGASHVRSVSLIVWNNIYVAVGAVVGVAFNSPSRHQRPTIPVHCFG